MRRAVTDLYTWYLNPSRAIESQVSDETDYLLQQAVTCTCNISVTTCEEEWISDRHSEKRMLLKGIFQMKVLQATESFQQGLFRKKIESSFAIFNHEILSGEFSDLT